MSDTLPLPRVGFIENGRFIEVSRRNLEAAGHTPPCKITMPNGALREIVVEAGPPAPKPQEIREEARG